MDRGDWWATIHGVTKSQTRPSDLARMHAHLGQLNLYSLCLCFFKKVLLFRCKYIFFSLLIGLSCCSVTKSRLTVCDPMDSAHQAPLSMGFPR